MNPPEPVLPSGATLWATVINGKIRGVGSGYPPHELKPCEFELTDQEYHFLKNLTNLDTAMPLLEAIQKKFKKVMRNQK